MTRYVFITGGVVSSLGKGIAAASLAAILEARGLKVPMMKIDPYINVDPGTMSPFQHGEVYVTDDGAETDLDIGHYERFLDVNLGRDANVHSKSPERARSSRSCAENRQRRLPLVLAQTADAQAQWPVDRLQRLRRAPQRRQLLAQHGAPFLRQCHRGEQLNPRAGPLLKRQHLAGAPRHHIGGSLALVADLPLPDETTVYPGHESFTTLGQERRSNPYLMGEVF